MSDEQRNEVNECKCICHSKGFRKFLIVALGSFVGVFCALSLFAALHRPPAIPCPMGNPYMRPPMGYHMHHFDKRGLKADFHKKMIKDKIEQRTPFEKDKD